MQKHHLEKCGGEKEKVPNSYCNRRTHLLQIASTKNSLVSVGKCCLACSQGNPMKAAHVLPKVIGEHTGVGERIRTLICGKSPV